MQQTNHRMVLNTIIAVSLFVLFCVIYLITSQFGIRSPQVSENYIGINTFLAIIIFVTLFSTISNLFFVNFERGSDALGSSFLMSPLITILAVVELLRLTVGVNESFYQVTCFLSNSILVFLAVSLSCHLVRIADNLAFTVAISLAGLNSIVGFVFFFYDDFWLSDEALLISGFTREFLIGFTPIIISILMFFSLSLRSVVSYRESWSFRFLGTGFKNKEIVFFWMQSISTLCFSVYAYSNFFTTFERAPGQAAFLFPMQSITSLWLPFLYYQFDLSLRFRQKYQEQKLLAGLASNDATSFVRRFFKKKSLYTNIGVRTSNFMIDHDPNGDANRSLPILFSQIRADDIIIRIHQILGDSLINKRVISSQVFGSLDPKTTVHTCIDAISLCAVIHLDVNPMVEKRVNNLLKLLPILDPSLYEVIQEEKIRRVISRTPLFFFVDYDWVDQKIQVSGDEINYSVHVSHMPIKEKTIVLDYLKTTKSIGNFIWISDKARKKLMMEAPYLSKIIEALPVPVGDSEIVVFLVKFEQLIPRLQSYYDFESWRKVLSDYESSREARQVLSMVGLQLNHLTEGKQILPLVETIKMYRWSGFREKDLALGFILRAYYVYKELKDITDHNFPEKEKKIFLDAIKVVGYPAQMAHVAHFEKRKIRDTDMILSVCMDVSHVSFEDAWMYIATADHSFATAEQIRLYCDIILKAIVDPKVIKHKIFRHKIIETFLNVVQHIENSDEGLELIEQINNEIAHFIVSANLEIELCNYFIDGQYFLEAKLADAIVLSHEAIAALDIFFLEKQQRLTPSASLSALANRWQAYKQQAELDVA